ncbi:ribonuclease Z [Candidatus Woesearchaeota archaeon]|nr:ribonuclease Z [Candidatus Woesearchaeota archaeon]
MQIIFLGTSCAMPTKERNHISIFVSYSSEGILFDCGEGTQRQLRIAGIKPTKITKILISHWHGDHTFGLPGLISTLSTSEYTKTLRIYGPKGTKEFIKNIFKSAVFENRINLEVIEIKEGVFFNGKDYQLEAYPLKHKTETLGFRFVEKNKRRINVPFIKKIGIPEGPLLGKLQEGKSVTWKGKRISVKEATYTVKGRIIAYLADSIPNKNSLKIAKDADILIAESTYTSELQEKADQYMHMTAKEAGLIANQANVKKLILTHFSTRYKDTHVLEEDARNVFDNVEASKDFMKVNL